MALGRLALGDAWRRRAARRGAPVFPLVRARPAPLAPRCGRRGVCARARSSRAGCALARGARDGVSGRGVRLRGDPCARDRGRSRDPPLARRDEAGPSDVSNEARRLAAPVATWGPVDAGFGGRLVSPGGAGTARPAEPGAAVGVCGLEIEHGARSTEQFAPCSLLRAYGSTAGISYNTSSAFCRFHAS